MRVGVLTGGGDCPGLNAVLRALVRKGERHFGDEVVGFYDAWDGVMERRTLPLSVESMRGTLPRGGTVLGTRRGSPFEVEGGLDMVEATFADMGLDGLIVVGGNGSLSVACRLHAERGLPIVGVPKTIDNDIEGTDVTFGFQTAVQIATDAIDRLHTTAESHDRVMVVEVMGRHSGWIATYAGIAGGAAMVLIPERPFDINKVCELVESRFRTKYSPIVVVAEGAVPVEGGDMTLQSGEVDAFGHVRLGGIGDRLAGEIEKRTGKEARAVVLGHVQRGGTPTAFDRWLATRFGLHAVTAVHDKDFGCMVALRGADIVRVPLAEGTGELKLVTPEQYAEAEVFFG